MLAGSSEVTHGVAAPPTGLLRSYMIFAAALSKHRLECSWKPPKVCYSVRSADACMRVRCHIHILHFGSEIEKTKLEITKRSCKYQMASSPIPWVFLFNLIHVCRAGLSGVCLHMVSFCGCIIEANNGSLSGFHLSQEKKNLLLSFRGNA